MALGIPFGIWTYNNPDQKDGDKIHCYASPFSYEIVPSTDPNSVDVTEQFEVYFFINFWLLMGSFIVLMVLLFGIWSKSNTLKKIASFF